MRLLFIGLLILLITRWLPAQVYPIQKDSLVVTMPGSKGVPKPEVVKAGRPIQSVYRGIKAFIPGEDRIMRDGMLRTTQKPEIIPCTIDKQTVIDSNYASPAEINTFYVKANDTAKLKRKGAIAQIDAGAPAQRRAGKALYREKALANIKYIDIAQGLFSSYIMAIERDTSGVIWMATYGNGVVSYNGRKFSQYSLPQNLHSNNIIDLLYDSKGRLWIASYDKGVAMYDGHAFHVFNRNTGLPGNKVHALLEGQNGNIFIGSDNGLTEYDGQTIKVYSHKQGLNCRQVYDLTQDSNGNIWIGTFNSGLIQFDGEHFFNYTVNNGLPSNTIWAVACDKQNNIWLGTYGAGIVKYADNQFALYQLAQGLPITEILSANTDQKGNVWFGTDGSGLLKYDGEAFTNIGVKHGLTNNKIWDVTQDPSGFYWFGSYGGGLMKYDGGMFTYHRNEKGLPGKIVLSFHEDREHNMWMGIWNQGLVKYDNENIAYWNEHNGLKETTIRSIIPGKDQNLWLATDGYGVAKFDGNSFEYFTKKHGLNHNEVATLFFDREETLWIGTYGGLTCYRNGKFIRYNKAAGLRVNDIRDITTDINQNLWIASADSGIAILVGKYFYHFSEKHGLSSNIVHDLYRDKKGNMWLATNNKINIIPRSVVDQLAAHAEQKVPAEAEELYNAFQNKIITLDEQNGLVSNVTKNILPDSAGNIWIGTEEGISRITPVSDIEKFSQTVEILGQSYIFTNYTYNEGFIGGDVFFKNSAYVDHNEKIWWGTGKVLTVYDPSATQPDTISPGVDITGLELFYNRIDWSNKAAIPGVIDQLRDEYDLGKSAKIIYDDVLPWNHIPQNLVLSHQLNHLTFNFTGLAWENPEKLQYSFMLEGYTDGWSPFNTAHSAIYSNLDPGVYTFKVRAVNNAGKLSETEAFQFKILPPWWQTTWFRITAFLTIMLIIYGGYQWRIAAFKERQRQLETTVSKRTAEISEKNEELQQQTEEIRTQRNEIEIQKDKVEKIYQDLTESIDYAQFIQNSMFASQQELKENFTEHFLLFYPRDKVSGDFYWWSKVDDQFVAAVADCTGHGVPGALMSMLGISFLREIVLKEHQTMPDQILNQLRSEIITALDQSMELGRQRDGLDIAIFTINPENDQLYYAGARNPLLIIRQGELIELKADKAPVSVYLKMKSFNMQQIQLQKGDQVYLFTDGYPDQFGGDKGQKFKRGHFKNLLLQLSGQPMELQFRVLKEKFHEWKGNYEQIDDITVLGIKI